jgi:hypothetical protein
MHYWHKGGAAIRAAYRRVQYEAIHYNVRIVYRYGAQGVDPDRRGDNGTAVNVQAGSGEGLICKERKSVVWPRRGYMGLYRHGLAFPNQGLWRQAAFLGGPRDHGASNP